MFNLFSFLQRDVNRRAIVFIFCLFTLCLPTFFFLSVRLMGSPLAHAGFVQIHRNGRWGSFCDWGWGLAQGHVVCRELGYRRALYTTIGGLFEKQSDWPIWVEEAECTGNESSIFECDLTFTWGNPQEHLCDHTHNAGVICESNKERELNGKLKVPYLKSFHLARKISTCWLKLEASQKTSKSALS